jgi:hypothetical protein
MHLLMSPPGAPRRCVLDARLRGHDNRGNVHTGQSGAGDGPSSQVMRPEARAGIQ